MKKSGKLGSVKLPELSEAYQKAMYWFFSFPDREIGLNDLSLELGIAKNTAKIVIELMENDGFIVKKVHGKAWRITCNKQHAYNYTRKVAFNLGIVFEAYAGGLRNQIFDIVGNAKAVILFGSYRKGDDTEKSDIDIAVEVLDNKDIRLVNLGTIPRLGYRQNVPVNLHIFSRNKIDMNLFSNIANGIVIEGFLEVRP